MNRKTILTPKIIAQRALYILTVSLHEKTNETITHTCGLSYSKNQWSACPFCYSSKVRIKIFKKRLDDNE